MFIKILIGVWFVGVAFMLCMGAINPITWSRHNKYRAEAMRRRGQKDPCDS